MATGASKSETVVVRPLNFQTVKLHIVGESPYVQNKFSQKAKNQIIETQKAGGQAKSKKTREAKDFDASYEGAMHKSREGWLGIPAPSFRNAMISACRTIGFKMTHAKLAVFVKADGFDLDDGTPLVKIHGKPRQHIAPARNDNGSIDIRCRPMWEEWDADVNMEFDADMFSVTDVVNLMVRAGKQVGIGEGRPDSRMSAGLGWGRFRVQEDGKK
jgi:hypothetical protein